MAKIPPLVEGPRKGGRNPVRENFIRPNPPPAFRAKQITTSTQAQIYAAANAMRSFWNDTKQSKCNWDSLATVALTAEDEHTYRQSQLDSAVEQTWSATIERCAQVVREMQEVCGHQLYNDIIARIRALKENP